MRGIFQPIPRCMYRARRMRAAGCVRGVTADGEMEFWKQPGLLGQKNGCTRYFIKYCTFGCDKIMDIGTVSFQ